MHRFLRSTLVAAISTAVAGCASTEQTETVGPDRVSGVVTSLDRVVLPSNAVIEVVLLDITRGWTVAAQTIESPGQLPVPFEIDFGPTLINPMHGYSIEARVVAEGQLQWLSTSTYLVITRGQPTEVEVMVESVRGADPEAIWNGVVSTAWRVDRIDGLPIIAGSRITLELDRGKLHGRAINTYNSSYERIGDSGMDVSLIASTRMYLDQPPGAMDQEARYLQLLRMTTGYRLEEGRLELLLDGGVVLELVPDDGP